MARMFPSSPAQTSSSAELWLFEYFKHLPDQWSVLHSLGSSRHEKKPWSEIDFTLIGPSGIILVEAKGGTVFRQGLSWFVRTAAGTTESLGLGPFRQVGGSESATRRFLQERIPELTNATFGYAVATPDCRLETNDLEIDSRIVLDAKDVRRPVADVVRGFTDYWRARHQRSSDLSQRQIDAVVDALGGDVPLLADLRRVALEVEQSMVLLTLEQERAIRDLEDNPAVWISGPAGSGKTLLSLSEAKRCTTSGKRTLLVCHSLALSRQFASTLKDEPLATVCTHLDLAVYSRTIHPPFDAVIVDEAQDLLDEGFTETIDQLLVGGLESGHWRVFIDPNQSLFGKVAPGSLDRWLGTRPTIKRLSSNCRTTHPIAITTSALSRVPLARGGVESAPVPTLAFTDDPFEAASHAVRFANEYVFQGLDPSEVVLLGPSSSAAQQGGALPAPIERELAPGIRHGTIASFKGFEATAVVLSGFGEIDSAQVRQQLYVGCSRATAFLSVVIPKASESFVWGEYARLLLSQSEG